MNHEELAWAAGFFDGEGSIGRYKNGRTRKDGTPCTIVRMFVSQKDPRPLERFHRAVGGVGYLYKRKNRLANGMHDWQGVKRADVHQVIWLLWPWLSEPKREQIARAC